MLLWGHWTIEVTMYGQCSSTLYSKISCAAVAINKSMYILYRLVPASSVDIVFFWLLWLSWTCIHLGWSGVKCTQLTYLPYICDDECVYLATWQFSITVNVFMYLSNQNLAGLVPSGFLEHSSWEILVSDAGCHGNLLWLTLTFMIYWSIFIAHRWPLLNLWTHGAYFMLYVLCSVPILTWSHLYRDVCFSVFRHINIIQDINIIFIEKYFYPLIMKPIWAGAGLKPGQSKVDLCQWTSNCDLLFVVILADQL